MEDKKTIRVYDKEFKENNMIDFLNSLKADDKKRIQLVKRNIIDSSMWKENSVNIVFFDKK